MWGKTPKAYSDFKFTRALYHIAFNFLANEKGLDHVLEEKYDFIRNYIRFPQKNEIWQYAQDMFSKDKDRPVIGAKIISNNIICLNILSNDFYIDIFNEGYLEPWCRENIHNKILLKP